MCVYMLYVRVCALTCTVRMFRYLPIILCVFMLVLMCVFFCVFACMLPCIHVCVHVSVFVYIIPMIRKLRFPTFPSLQRE